MALLLAVDSQTADANQAARQFLERLREVGYYDTAIVYLERIAKEPGIDQELIDALDLERAQVYVDAALNAPSASAQEDNFRLAEERLQNFLKSQSKHPRSSEARLQLGRLQMVRAQALLAAEPDEQKKERAREVYLSASKTFQEITDKLRVTLQEMRGEKIDPNTQPERIAQRDQYRYEFLQAQYSVGETKRLAAETFSNPARDGKKLLEEAEKQFADLAEKYGEYVQGALATVALGQTQESLGKLDQAKLSFLNMLEQPDADPLREAKLAAMEGLLRIAVEQKSPDYGDVIDRARVMSDQLRPNELELASVQTFRTELAEANLYKSRDEKFNGAVRKRASSDARRLLLAAEKVPGPHIAETQRLLQEIGIDRNKVVDVDIEKPQSLDDALTVAQTYLKTSESLVAKAETQTGDEKKQTNAKLKETRTKAIEVLRYGLGMVRPDSELETVNNARQFLTYFLLLEGRYRETAAVGSFLARVAPGTETGKNSGLWALTALQQLLVESGDDIDDGLAAQVTQLGDYLTQTWPGDKQTAQAQGVMIRIALRKKKFDDAETLIAKIDNESEKAAMQRLAGQVLWTQSLQAQRDKNQEDEKAFRDKSISMLQQGLNNLPGKLAGGEAVSAALSLAKAQLQDDAPQQALKTLKDPKHGPLSLVSKIDPPSENHVSDVYATELNALVGLLTTGSGNQSKLIADMDRAMTNLRASIKGANAQQSLIDTLVRLAKDLRGQVERAPAAKKQRFIDAFEIFLKRISQNAKEPTVVQWVAQESMNLGESLMTPGVTQAAGKSFELITTAAQALEKLEESSKEPTPELLFQLGRAKRLLGDYPAALNHFTTLLKQNPLMLDAQVEAALVYEQWAAVIKPVHAPNAYKAALTGGRPDAKGKNVIWGWGDISQAASRDPKFQDTFFEARYHVAFCRFQMGKAMGRDDVIRKAISDITLVQAVYPNMGGPQRKAKFDALLKQIQKAAGEPVTGLR